MAAARIETLKAHLLDSPPPAVCDQSFHDAWIAAGDIDERVRFATAQAAEMAAARPWIKPGELILGANALGPLVTGMPATFGHGIAVDRVRLAELRAQSPQGAARADEIEAYWDAWLDETKYERPMTMHASLAYERFLEKGVDGVRRYVEHWRDLNVPKGPESGPWYRALEITLDGISDFIDAHARAAEEAADAAEGERRVELQRAAANCRHVAHAAPESFHQAVQLWYLLYWLCGHDSPGPVDRHLYPALKRDLDRGALTLAEAQELVDCLWLKFAEKTAYGTTIGGQLEDGSDACNELTMLCLSAIRRLRLLSPRTAFRWHGAVSQPAFGEACAVIASGASFPALVNDEAMIPALLERGVALEHARNYTFVGCGQTYPHGRGHGHYEDVIINSAKPLELALNDGVDPMTGKRLGPATGAPDRFATYEQFQQAYRCQMDHHITQAVEAVNRHRDRHRRRWCDCLRSLLTYSCVERGLDWHAGGADYSEGMVDMVGLTTVTDSLAAIRYAVYERQILSLAELRDKLNRDWQGAAALRLQLLKKAPKFGNDEAGIDEFTAAEFERVNRHIKSHRTVFGGPWGMDVIGWSGAVTLGEQTGATPDGRRRGEPLADCAGPAQGRNVRGLMATLGSMLKLPHDRTHGPLALSLRFPGEVVASPEGVTALRTAAQTYLRAGGQQLQISIASSAELRAAQREPEKHEDIVVRVGGFSAYFTKLEKKYQDDVIARSEALV